MPARYADWFRQAKRDLQHARRAAEAGEYEWACFAAQQGAEKGVKAAYMRLNRDAWGHSVTALLQQLPEPWQADEALVDMGRELDKHYIPPRYPNSYPEGAPYDYYTRGDAERAIDCASHILAFCEGVLAERGPGSQDAPDSSGAPGGETSGD